MSVPQLRTELDKNKAFQYAAGSFWNDVQKNELNLIWYDSQFYILK